MDNDIEGAEILNRHDCGQVSVNPVEDNALSIPFEKWEETGIDETKRGRLYTNMKINGYPLHLEAVSVVVDEDSGEQQSEESAFTRDVENLLETQGVARFITITIGERDYVIFATPFA